MSGIILLLLGLTIYFVPFLVAVNRKHHNTGAIFVFNLFLGWTFIGWVWALIWACTYTSRPHLPGQPTRPNALPPALPRNRKYATLGKTIAAIFLGILFILTVLWFASRTMPYSVNRQQPGSPVIETAATIAPTLRGSSNDSEIRIANDKALAKLRVAPQPKTTLKANSTASPNNYLSTEAWNGSDFQVAKGTWEKGGFNAVAIWHVTIKNMTDRPIGNFSYTTNYDSETSVNHGSNSGRLEKRLEPNQTKTFEINDGFIQSQADRADIDFTKAEFLGGHEAKAHKAH